jgi:hypothetical protein
LHLFGLRQTGDARRAVDLIDKAAALRVGISPPFQSLFGSHCLWCDADELRLSPIRDLRLQQFFCGGQICALIPTALARTWKQWFPGRD